MIIEASREIDGGHEMVDVVVDPFNVLVELSKEWRLSIGVQSHSPIMGGYWMTSGLNPPYNRIRLATREEIVRFEAFKEITAYTATLFS